jgi:diguanylate cyclase (GGDEF)-like protein
MEYIIQFQINIFALSILVLLYIVVNVRITVETFSRKLLLILILVSGAAIITEPLTWIFDSQQFFGAYFLEYLTNMMLIMFGPIIAGLMLSYVRYYTEKDISVVYKHWYYMHPAILTAVMLVINIFYPIYFSIDKTSNMYTVGDYYFVHFIILIIMYIYMVIIGLNQRDKVDRKISTLFMIFFVIPFIAMIVQWFNVDILLSWNSIVLGILVVYIFVESSNGETDFLTRIYNRSSYEKYVNQLLEQRKDFKILFMDLDKFKQINDTFGHLAGDIVLKEFAIAIRHVAEKNEMVARLGGDEFMMVIESGKGIKQIVKDIYEVLKSTKNPLLENVTFSYGAYTHPVDITVDEIYASVDKEMYAFKNKNHFLNRRETDPNCKE